MGVHLRHMTRRGVSHRWWAASGQRVPFTITKRRKTISCKKKPSVQFSFEAQAIVKHMFHPLCNGPGRISSVCVCVCVSRQNHANIEATGNLVLVAIVRINIYSTRYCKRLPHFTSRLSDRFQILHTPYGETEFSPTMVRGGQCTCDSCRSSRAAVCVCVVREMARA